MQTKANPGDRIMSLEAFDYYNQMFYEKDFPYAADADRKSQRIWKDWNQFKLFINLYNKRIGARVGDYCKMLNGEIVRFTYDWGELIQTTPRQRDRYDYLQGRCGTFAAGFLDPLGSGSYISYSGSLDSAIPKSLIKLTNTENFGMVWLFSNNFWGANRAVCCYVPFRVFEEVEGFRLLHEEEYDG